MKRYGVSPTLENVTLTVSITGIDTIFHVITNGEVNLEEERKFKRLYNSRPNKKIQVEEMSMAAN